MKIVLLLSALFLAANAHWITMCDEDGECKQVWIVEQ